MNNYNLQIGMEFKSYKDFSDFIGYEETKSREVLRNRLKHHCEFHKIKNTIIIDKIKNVDGLYIGNLLNYKFNIGDIVEVSTGKVIILERFMRKMKSGHNRRFYKCQCCSDGYIYEIVQDSLLKGVGCNVCLNHVVIKGINDVATTHPHIANLIVGENKYRYTAHSRKIVTFKCPDCGFEKKMAINDVTSIGHIRCNQCSDNFSYPNKFVYCAISQVCSDLVCEKVFEWSGRKRYDLYSESNNLIIENHGKFHYDKNIQLYDQQYEFTVQNDKFKKKLAMTNNIKNYISLDCRKSEKEFIKNSIMTSKLPSLLNFHVDDIDWEQCEKYAITSKLNEAYKLYKQGVTDSHEIANVLNISYSTCMRYLKTAKEIYQ